MDRLKEAIKEYNRICKKLEELNEYAFSLEQEILILQAQKKREEQK